MVLSIRQQTNADATLSRVRKLLDDPGMAGLRLAVTMEMSPFLAQHRQTNALVDLLTECLQRGEAPPFDWILSVIDAARERHEFPQYLEQPLRDLRVKLKMPA
jgi:hypothetical protein